MPIGIIDGTRTAFRDSILGELIYHMSGHKLLKPPIRCFDYKIDGKYEAHNEECVGAVPSTSFSSAHEPEPKSEEVTPTLSAECKERGFCLVTWDGDNDPENPKNWAPFKKGMISIILSFLTTSAYMASAIFTPAEEQMLEYFGTSQVKLMLGLTMFVWGYGLGPIFVSAMSESPLLGGRRYIFLVGQFLFIILQIPTALATNLGGFVVLRFLAGLATAPTLSVGPAALGDMFSFPSSAYITVAWSLGAVCGPYLGPVIGAALAHSNTWRWVFWYLLIQGGLPFALMLFLLPETSEQALLMRKAQRLRQMTGNANLKSPGDLVKERSTLKKQIKIILWLPVELCLREPVLDLVNLHLSLLYAVIYIFFEAFPIVYIETFNFTLVEEGTAFCGQLAGIIVAVVLYLLHLNRNLVKPIEDGNPNTPEFVFGRSALFGSILVPIGLFIFGWSATPSAHWMGPIMGGFLFSIGTFILFQSYIAYIGNLYPTRFASGIASSIVLRSLIGGAFPLFGTVFYRHTGTKNYPVGWGSSILAFAGLAMVLLPVYFLKYGAQLRQKTLEKYGAIK